MSSWCRYQTNQWQFLDNLKKKSECLDWARCAFFMSTCECSVFMLQFFSFHAMFVLLWKMFTCFLGRYFVNAVHCAFKYGYQTGPVTYRVTASEWFTMSNGIESADVSINTSRRSTSHRPSLFSRSVFADFWFTHNLLPQEETSIALNKVDSQEAFTACGAPCPRQRGRWGCWSRSWSHCR